MDKLKRCLGNVKVALRSEITKVKRLKGKKFDKFCEIFGTHEEDIIYFNPYNILFISEETHQKLLPYLKQESLVLKMLIPEHNTNLWVYQYFNDQVLDSYLND